MLANLHQAGYSMRVGGSFSNSLRPEPYCFLASTFQRMVGQEFREDGLEQITIPAALRQHLRDVLDTYGVNRGTLFPDLDGQARYIKWLKTS
jgi:hypothetical protein